MYEGPIGEQIELSIELEPDLSKVMADPGHIEQMILNLAINARDCHADGGNSLHHHVLERINASEWSLLVLPRFYICVQFSDNGTGMSADVRDRPSSRSSPRNQRRRVRTRSRKRSTESSCSRVVSSDLFRRGDLERASHPASDRSRSVEPGQRSSKVDVTVPAHGSKTVLVVDDEEGLREVTRRILQSFWLQGAHGVEWRRGNRDRGDTSRTLDLLLTDVIMATLQGQLSPRK